MHWNHSFQKSERGSFLLKNPSIMEGSNESLLFHTLWRKRGDSSTVFPAQKGSNSHLFPISARLQPPALNQKLSTLHSPVENLSDWNQSGAAQSVVGGWEHQFRTSGKRGLGADPSSGHCSDFLHRVFCPKALWTWISNWAKISADPGCLGDWTTDILCLFSPRTCRGF